MKKVFLIKLPLTAALLFALASPVPTAEAASIKTVNFYPAGARFTYEEKSDGEFEFDIPGAFDENSVKCLTLENMSSLKVERVAVPNAEPEELAPYSKKVGDAKKALALLESRMTSVKSAIQFLSSPFTQSPYDKDAALNGDGLIKYARDAYHMRLELEAEMVEVNIGIEKTTRDIAEAEREYADVKARLERKRGIVPDSVIRVRGTTDGPATLVFDAFTKFAVWNVVY